VPSRAVTSSRSPRAARQIRSFAEVIAAAKTSAGRSESPGRRRCCRIQTCTRPEPPDASCGRRKSHCHRSIASQPYCRVAQGFRREGGVPHPFLDKRNNFIADGCKAPATSTHARLSARKSQARALENFPRPPSFLVHNHPSGARRPRAAPTIDIRGTLSRSQDRSAFRGARTNIIVGRERACQPEGGKTDLAK